MKTRIFQKTAQKKDTKNAVECNSYRLIMGLKHVLKKCLCNIFLLWLVSAKVVGIFERDTKMKYILAAEIMSWIWVT